jgi:hypothetical protein
MEPSAATYLEPFTHKGARVILLLLEWHNGSEQGATKHYYHTSKTELPAQCRPQPHRTNINLHIHSITMLLQFQSKNLQLHLPFL